MCDCYTLAGEPIPTNNRPNAAKIFSHHDVVAEETWYEIEQEYTLLQKDVHWPLGWPIRGYPGPQGPYYCSAGADKSFGRDIVDAHYKACLYAGINISGINGEVMHGQATFKDSMEEEAIAKNYSTTKEAIGAGALAGAYCIILTYFSQRYPKIQVFDKTDIDRTCIAFDMMSINAADLHVLPNILPLLKVLFKMICLMMNPSLKTYKCLLCNKKLN